LIAGNAIARLRSKGRSERAADRAKPTVQRTIG